MSESNKQWMLTTIDNPYSPFTNFKEWYKEDMRLGYNTCGIIGRLSNPADDFNDDSYFTVMREIIEYNWSGKHIMITQELWSDSIEAPS